MKTQAWTLCLVSLVLTGECAQPVVQQRAVAIAVDDLPYARGSLPTPIDGEVRRTAEIVNRRLLAAFKTHHVPVTGFVIQKGVESLGLTIGTRILMEWITYEFDLGNHTYSHPEYQRTVPGAD
jgi:peptidoglycan/xylan/chitin deacetylase (PgdA/CDA1 family)